MKVIQIKLRTPGLYLSKMSPLAGVPSPVLVLEIQEGEEWKPVEQIPDLQVLKEGFLTEENFMTREELEIESEVEVPIYGEGTKFYKILVPDNKTWKYRIRATPCIECVKFFRTYNKPERIIGNDAIVAEGEITS